MDLERYRLRHFLDSLPATELERREQPVELADVAAVHESNAKAVWFAHAGGAELAAIVAASRSRLAIAFGTTPRQAMTPVNSGRSAPNSAWRIRECTPSAPTSASPRTVAPFSNCSVTLSSSCTKPRARAPRCKASGFARERLQLLADAKRIEHARAVRRELHARANLAQLASLLVDIDLDAMF